MPILHFVNNEYIYSSNREKIPVYNPATGQKIDDEENGDASSVEAAVEAAKAAFEHWSQTSCEERSRILERIGQNILKKLDQFAHLESANQGKPLWLAKSLDIPRSAHNFTFFASAIKHWQQSCSQQDKKSIDITLRHPLGVVGLISPWNLPLYLLTWKIAPAIACGNTVVCKPSELTPLTANLLTEVLLESNLPKGVCNIVYGYGKDVGEAIVTHPNVKAISFTGGTETGIRIAELSARQLKKVSLELGGKNPSIIFADCNLEDCLQTTIRSCFLNQGEICLCTSRLFVEESIFPVFLERFVALCKKLKVGTPSDETTFLGPLISANHRAKVLYYIKQAIKEGALLQCGEGVSHLDQALSNGYFVSPTVLTNCSPQSSIMQEEVFGPVVTISPFNSETEAIFLANQIKYGLAATVWTSNLGKAHRLAQDLEAGQIWINNWMKRDLRVPFGGMKQSGLGREGGTQALEFFTEAKNVCINFS